MSKNCSYNFLQYCTAHTDLQNGAKKIYKGKQYRNEETQNIYEFIEFIEHSPEGQVRAKNLTKGLIEILTSESWFSFHRVPKK
jgi:hypothetical protein